MTRKKICKGCGVRLQDQNILQEGYTTDIKNDLCQRCFRMKNYGEYQVVTKSNEEYEAILKSIGRTKDLVLFMVDVTNLDQDITYIRKYISNPMLLLLNKWDILPRSVKEEKIISNITACGGDFLEIIPISCKNNYQIDLLYNKIKKYKKSNRVYVVGHTNVGKSSLINQMIHSYSTSDQELTISPLPSTTLNKLEIVLNDELTLIDTPGLVDRGSFSNYITASDLKQIQSKKEMRPRTFQMKPGQGILIGNLVRMDYIEGEKNSFTVYVSNNLKVKRINAYRQEALKDLFEKSYDLKFYEDIVIDGLGWIKVVGRGKVALYLPKEVSSYTRKNLI